MTNEDKAIGLLNDYIKQLKWSLSKLPSEDREEIIQEVHGHLLDRLKGSESVEDFQEILEEFGPPDMYARSFLENYEASVALASASPWQILQQNFRMISHGSSVVLSFLVILFLYILSVFLVLVGLLKPLFPNHIGLWVSRSPFSFLFGFKLSPESNSELLGYWIIPLAILLGTALFIATSRLSRYSLIAVTERQFSKIRVFSITIVLVVLVLGILITQSVIVVSGRTAAYVLKADKTRLGILVVQEDAKAILKENAHWIGPVFIKEGTFTVENDVTVTGPVLLFANGLELAENATIRGGVYLFSGSLRLGSSASVGRDAVLFAGSLDLGEEAIVRDDVVLFAGDLGLAKDAVIRDDAFLFAGDVELREGAALRGDTLLFAGRMRLGQKADARGDLILFAGGLDLAEAAVAHDDIVLFAGDLHVSPKAVVEEDVVVVDGDANLEAQAVIFGNVYYNLDPDSGKVYQDASAQVNGSVSGRDNIDSIAGWRVAVFFFKHLLKRLLPPVIIIILTVYLIRFWRRRRAMFTQSVEAQAVSS
jgi:uncharacterized membrane protein